jgi:sec-independent protein translocase protein TatA
MRIGPLGMTELLLILVVVLLIFGASRLPGVGSALGKGIRSFKTSVTGEDDVARRESGSTESSTEERRS